METTSQASRQAQVAILHLKHSHSQPCTFFFFSHLPYPPLPTPLPHHQTLPLKALPSHETCMQNQNPSQRLPSPPLLSLAARHSKSISLHSHVPSSPPARPSLAPALAPPSHQNPVSSFSPPQKISFSKLYSPGCSYCR